MTVNFRTSGVRRADNFGLQRFGKKTAASSSRALGSSLGKNKLETRPWERILHRAEAQSELPLWQLYSRDTREMLRRVEENSVGLISESEIWLESREFRSAWPQFQRERDLISSDIRSIRANTFSRAKILRETRQDKKISNDASAIDRARAQNTRNAFLLHGRPINYLRINVTHATSLSHSTTRAFPLVISSRV